MQSDAIDEIGMQEFKQNRLSSVYVLVRQVETSNKMSQPGPAISALSYFCTPFYFVFTLAQLTDLPE